MTLKIADNLNLPPDFITSTQAILARKGSGKSYTASVQAEELLKAGHQVVVIDPTGAWWGLRGSADGKGEGFPIAVLGGEHGDVPLQTTAGEVIADAIATEHFSAVIDLSLFRKGEAVSFMTAFLETLYRRNREALHLFVDEADAYAAQKPQKGAERCLGAIEDVVRRGRIRGIGCTLITQRPAVLNKNVLTQCEMLGCLRMSHPLDIDAVMEWVNVHADEDTADAMIESLPDLPIGTAWFWNPGHALFKRVEVRKRITFDSGATPKAGQRVAVPKTLAAVDIQKLGAAIAATVEKAKENDTRALRAEIAKLKAELAKKAKTEVREVVKEVQVQVAPPGLLEKVIASVRGAFQNMPVAPKPTPAPRPVVRERVDFESRSVTYTTTGRLATGERNILAAIAQHPSGVTREQLTVLTGYKRSSRDTYLQRIGSAGYCRFEDGRVLATDEGVAALGADFKPLPTGEELREHWLQKLPEGERRILEILIAEYPKPVQRDVLSDVTGYKRSSRDTYLQRLSARELVGTERGEVRASETLFEVAA